MPLHEWLLFVLTASELVLLLLVVVFFARLRKSEDLLTNLRANQAGLITKLEQNARLERELVESFEERQAELLALDDKLQKRREELTQLLSQAEEYTRSPEFLRHVILTGHKKGQPVKALARATGLSVDEVELILDQEGS
ncbi:hypothetical protein JCM15519_34140 [Fundidesulfovibrio butyratiphilus]